MLTQVRRRYIFCGQCQGVGFRWNARALACKLHMSGWVKNLSGGDVVLELQGTEDDITRFMERLFQTYRAMHIEFRIVNELDVTPQTDAQDFEIRF